MVAHENVFNSSKISSIKTKEELITAMLSIIPCYLTNNDVVFLCIGTDRSTGDSLAPFVGYYLKEFGYSNVFGTIDDPIHAMNLKDTIRMLENFYSDKKIITIDATLGNGNKIGTYSVIKGVIKPGAGVKKDLPEIGDYSITGCVNVGMCEGNLAYQVLQSTRLSLVVKMAKDITSAIMEVFPLNDENNYEYINDININNRNEVKI